MRQFGSDQRVSTNRTFLLPSPVYEPRPSLNRISGRLLNTLGFVPYSPKVVLEKVRAWQPPESTPPRDPFRSSSPIEATPHGPREIQKLGTELQDDLDDYDIPEELREKFGRYIKGSLVGASSLALAERDIEATHNHSKAKAKRDKLGGSVAQKGGGNNRSTGKG